jgi:DNA-binding transcriptional ArsR family regulator
MNANSRLRRLITEEVGECCDAAVEERLATLETLEETVPAKTADERAALRTLSDETRHRIVRLLAAADEELCVCELTPLLEVSDSAISHALSDLTDAGLVSRRKEGAWRYYQPTERAEQLVETLDATWGEDR